MSTQDYSQQVNAAFTSLRKGLLPFVEQEMKTVYGDHWLDECQRAGIRPNRDGYYTWDVMALLKIITNAYCWREVFKKAKLRGAKERGVFVTLLEWRHELKGHDDKDISKQTAQDLIESVVLVLRCVGAEAEIKVAEELLLSLNSTLQPEPVEPTSSSEPPNFTPRIPRPPLSQVMKKDEQNDYLATAAINNFVTIQTDNLDNSQKLPDIQIQSIPSINNEVQKQESQKITTLRTSLECQDFRC